MGDTDAAKVWLERAQETASRFSFNRFVFAAEEALSANSVHAAPKVSAPAFDIPRDVERIAEELSDLRRLTGVN